MTRVHTAIQIDPSDLIPKADPATLRKRLFPPQRRAPKRNKPTATANVDANLRPVPPAPRVQHTPRPLWTWADINFDAHVTDWKARPVRVELQVEDDVAPSRSMTEIASEVLKDFPGVTLADIRGPLRTIAVVKPRQIAMYWIYRERDDLSYPRIGAYFGGRDHTTVLHAVRKYEAVYGKIERGARH